MGWSPRQLGELADTSRRAVRHYQEIGLLSEPEPERTSNGYRQYGVDHLVRLLRIRRLTQLGLTLPQIAAIGSGDEHPAQSLRELDADIKVKIEELQHTRREIATMLQRAAPTDLPLEIASHAEDLPSADRALLVVLSRLLEPVALTAYVDLSRPYRRNAAVVAFDDLTADSDEQARSEIARGIADHLRRLSSRHANNIERIHGGVRARSRVGSATKQQTINAAIVDLYNPAQRDVLARSRKLLKWGPQTMVRAV